MTGTNHEADQPVHLQLKDKELPIKFTLNAYDEQSQRYCPAGIYKVVKTETQYPKFIINEQNCIHCKTWDFKVPSQNIN